MSRPAGGPPPRPEAPLFGDRTLGVRFRPFQERLLEALERKLRAGDRRLHLVAPPGAGKTLLGLALVERIGRPAVVLCPNTTIQGQWPDKARRFLVDTGPGAAVDEALGTAPPAVSADPASGAPVVVVTYQLFAAREAAGAGPGAGEDPEGLFTGLAARGYRTLVLDECHHLTGRWAEVVAGFLARHPDAFVVGLTATPPVDRTDREVRRYLDVVGEVDVEVPLPAVVRDGLLAPFQDLVRFVVPTPGEVARLRERVRGVEALIRRLEAPPDGLDPLSTWVEERLVRPRWGDASWRGFAGLAADEPAVARALTRYYEGRGLALPAEAFALDEVPQPPSAEDLALIVARYLEEHLAPAASPEARALAAEAEAALGALGYRREAGRFVRAAAPIARTLALSAAKRVALREVLAAEAEAMGEALRALVVTDFVTAHAAGEGADLDVDDPEAGGAAGAFQALLADPRTDALDPILVTGAAVLCDDEIAARVRDRGRAWLAARGLRADLDVHPREGFYAVEGTGPDWGSRAFVGLVTALLDEGTTRCLVGTRALLGEGWDCERLNTLVDLTSVSAFVTVNQVRGRTLRLDPEDPAKTANNWDIVAVLPGVLGGEADLERFLRKHEHFYGPTDDGDLQRGAGHVHPAFTHLSRDRLLARAEALNAELAAWGADRARALRTWRVGEPYRGEEVAALELVAPEVGPEAPRGPAEEGAGARLAVVDAEALPAPGAAGAALLGLVGGGAVGAALLAAGAATGVGVAVGLGAAAVPGLWRWGALRRRVAAAVREVPLEAWLGRAAEAVAEALRASGLLDAGAAPALSRRSDGSLSLRLEGAGPDDSARFATAMGELLGPVERPRYLLVAWQPVPPRSPAGALRWRAERDRVAALTLPVPAELAAHRERADALAAAWTARLGPAEAVFVGTREARERHLPVLLPLAARRPALRRVLRRLWR